MLLLLTACLSMAAIVGIVAAKARQCRKVRAWRAERQHRHRDWWVCIFGSANRAGTSA